MFAHIKIKNLNDFFVERDNRPSKGVYFYRINGYTEEIGLFIQKYYEAARLSGVIIEGRIPNPDEKNLAYYEEIMGLNFRMNTEFISQSLRKWLPRMNDYQRGNVARALYDTLDTLRKSGKNDNMLKNAYIKFMCWLYYKFERIVNLLGENKVPKILYEGEVSSYELQLITVLSNAGCDVVLLQYGGDIRYRSLDADSQISDNLVLPDMQAFPPNFNLKWIRAEIQNALNTERLYGIKPQILNCTNAWIEGKGLSDIRKSIPARGSDPKLFYNCFYRINGVEDKLTYANELYQFQLELTNSQRRVVIVDECIPKPGMDEIGAVNRRNYARQDEMLMDLSANIQYTANIELQRVMVKAFLDVMLAEAKRPDRNLNKLTNKAVYLICWLKRYQKKLFSNWKMPDVGCFIHMGPCRDENEAMFLRFLARLPVDVLVLNPDLNTSCCLEDNLLYEIRFAESLPMNRYPQQSADLQVGTVAYHAERELDGLMYQDTGIYRNFQYDKAVSITLQTMYEEIRILWKEELKYRPGFSTENGIVTLPVIFAKISGVKDGIVQKYWSSIKELITEDTFVVKNVPYIDSTVPNPMKTYAVEFFRNGRLQRKKIREHPNYPYSFLREEIQEHIFDKLQLLIESKVIKGTFENGTEYMIVATILNMPKEIVRLIQKFDFTKKNPKLIYINTGEKIISIEDSILTAFLNLAGFDVVFFVPTGYQNIEKHFNKRLMEEHQIGEYVYDLQVPNMALVSSNTRPSWRDRLFRRGM
ncbi:MAG: YceG family protein [Lachnospiraceae bacterium]|nr:YceG family protein [Lachnospiraceae bacterium]